MNNISIFKLQIEVWQNGIERFELSTFGQRNSNIRSTIILKPSVHQISGQYIILTRNVGKGLQCLPTFEARIIYLPEISCTV